VQTQDLSFYWMYGDRGAVGDAIERTRPRAGGHHNLLGRHALTTGEADARDPAVSSRELGYRHIRAELTAGEAHCLGQRRGHLARVYSVVVGHVEGQTERRGERRLQTSCLAGPEPVGSQTERLSQGKFTAQGLGLVAVPGHEQRAAAQIAGVHAGGLVQLGDEARVGVYARQPEAHQRQLGGQRLADRREHSGRHRGGMPGRLVAALEHDNL
jgi:hypothetical protein